MLRRVITTALTCASLYAAGLGAGAAAQDVAAPAPEPTATSTAAATAAPATTPAPTPTPAPVVETVLSAPEEPVTDAAAESEPQPAPEPAATEPASATTETPAATPEAPVTSPEAPVATPGPPAKGTPARGGTDAGADPCALDREASISDRASHCERAAGEPGDDERKAAERKAKARTKAKAEADAHDHAPDVIRRAPARRADGTPTLDHPTYAAAEPGAAPIGVPNFFIEKFRIPPFLLPIYQAAGMEYGVRWEVLAAINEIETDYGRNLNVSSAGALGWMQFMPPTWRAYGVDANKDGEKDPYNPVDAIFAAARYLKAAGAETDLRKAIFAYNHADWYVDSVMLRARVIGGLPANFVGSLTGLTQARFPVWAKATYAGEVRPQDARTRVRSGNAARVVESDATRRGIRIFARRGAPVIAVNDGRIVRAGTTQRLGRFVQLRDVYGNTFTYAHLGSVAGTYPHPRRRTVSRAAVRRELSLPKADRRPTAAASRTRRQAARRPTPTPAATPTPTPTPTPEALPAPVPAKQRLFAHPGRPRAFDSGGGRQLDGVRPGQELPRIAGGPLKLSPRDYEARALRPGARVLAGTILGRIGATRPGQAAHVLFEVRPAGRGAPRVDPKPILDGWKLLETTAIYRAAKRNPFFGRDAATPSIGQVLLMGKDALARRVLANPRIDIYGCGRTDVRMGAIDRRVLATLEYLAASGLRPTVTSLRCGHGTYTSSGNVSHHSSGNAVDIAAVNGIPMTGNQGKGSITDVTVQRLLTLQGTLEPTQIISLMTYEGAENTFAMADHHDHIHVGWRPLDGTDAKAAKVANAVLKPKQWIKLIDRLKEIDNPTVRVEPSKYSVKVPKRASRAHRGE